MFSTLRIYIKQRFNPFIFGGLCLFLLFFAKGKAAFSANDLLILPILLFILFVFRLFDDLQNKDFDQNKTDQRIYTLPSAAQKLLIFLFTFSAIILLFVFYFEWRFGILLSSFLILNYLLYRSLLNRWKFRNLLPLVKYPFLCILLMMALNNKLLLQADTLILCLSVFPAFVLFESLTDENFKLNKWVFHALFGICFLSFFFVFPVNYFNLISLIFIVLSYLVCIFSKSSYSGYIFLTLFLLTRLTYTYGI